MAIYRDGIAAFHRRVLRRTPHAGVRCPVCAGCSIRPWIGQRDAIRHGPIAPQLPGRLAAVAGAAIPGPASRDCLTLTISATTAPDTKARPVSVWLHGGAWMFGSGSSTAERRCPAGARGGPGCVGMNYRLGALGWLLRPGIVDAEGGTSDQIMALRWVRDHIAGFGGDLAA